MIRLAIILLFSSFSALAYIPTVESLFRHGENPDVTANGVSVTFAIKKIDGSVKSEVPSDSSLLSEAKSEDFYKLFFTKISSDSMKVAQTRYDNSSFSEGSLIGKQFFSNFTAYTIKSNPEDTEKGLFHAMLRSMVFNDGAFIINYLKSLGVPVKLNNEIINRQKVEYLASYKQYLVAINKDRTSKKTELNPLKPDDLVEREKIEKVMSGPMYVDQGQVKLTRDNGEIAWLVTADSFEAVISYKERDIKRFKYKSPLGEIEMTCKDYWLANGTHSLPRYILVKDYKGESYQVEILNLRHYLEKEVDLINRLKKWDSLLKGKDSHDPKPPFIL